jgi:hypothetical protein
VSPPEFVKHDNGKLRFDLLDDAFEAEVAAVLTHGATKYADNNWQRANPSEAKARYYAAIRRHLSAWRRGEEIDPDSGQPHLACVACSVMFLRWFERETDAYHRALAEAIQQRIDDREEAALAMVDEEFNREYDR